MRTQIFTHMCMQAHTHIYIYICVCVCVCMCVCVFSKIPNTVRD